MCGIFGYYNYSVQKDLKEILDTIFQGLRRLEYRGYDSAGVCVDRYDVSLARPPSLNNILAAANGTAANGVANGHPAKRSEPHVIKCAAKISELEAKAWEYLKEHDLELHKTYSNHVAISHTRWATHGPPAIVNAHPHVSDANMDFVVCHNGIITNYKALKEWLTKHGEVFESDTDTEVIPKLCKYVYNAQVGEKQPFPKLVMDVLSRLEGAYALLIKSRHYPGELVACKRGSPMILGVREPEGLAKFNSLGDLMSMHGDRIDGPIECWIASDASAVIEHTKRVIVLEDDDVMHISGGGYGVYNRAHQDPHSTVSRVLQTLALEVDQIMKGEYDHFMQKEIHEQPEALMQTMQGRVQFQRAAIGNPWKTARVKLGGLTDTADTIRRSRRIMFVACGTSYHSCLAARSIVEEMVEIPVALELASDLLDRMAPICRDDTCVFVSQSGETADTLRALEYAKSRGALCVGITNSVGSAISRATHCGVHQHAGPEIGVASTKAYTSQILCITLMALNLAEDSISKRERRDSIIDEMGQLPGKVRAALMLDGAMRKLAAELKDINSLLFFARGNNYATALEAALKAKEVSLIHSEGILGGEMKHGPLALVDEHMPIVVVATRDSMYKKMESVIQQLLARNARLIVLCNEGDESLRTYGDRCQLIEVPHTADCLQPIVNIVPLQLLSYHITTLRGLNVDQPRNLAKSVTVTD